MLFLCALGHSVLGVLFYQAFGSVLPAVFTSGILIFLLSELVPHIVCSGYGFQLAPGLTWLAQLCMVLTCPLSCPLGLVLDLALRRDVSTCGIRERTMEMIRTSVNDPYRCGLFACAPTHADAHQHIHSVSHTRLSSLPSLSSIMFSLRRPFCLSLCVTHPRFPSRIY